MKHMKSGLTDEELNRLKREPDEPLFRLPRRIVDRIELPASICGCWKVNGWNDGKGYAKMKVNGRARYVHRVAFELIVGPFPLGLVLHHLCYERACCNPLHLVPETNEFNLKDGAAVLFTRNIHPELQLVQDEQPWIHDPEFEDANW